MRLQLSQLTLHKLEVFCAVAELESISRAAERMFSCVCELTSALKTAGAFGDSNDKSFTYIFCSSSCLVVPVFAGCSAISFFLWLPAVMPRSVWG